MGKCEDCGVELKKMNTPLWGDKTICTKCISKKATKQFKKSRTETANNKPVKNEGVVNKPLVKEPKALVKFKELHKNEGGNIVAWAPGYIGKAKENKFGVLIVTDSRVIFYKKGIIEEIFEAILLKNITSIERKTTLIHRTIRIHASNDDLEFKTFHRENEEPLIAAIEAGLSKKVNDSENSPPKENNLDKIKKLAELKDDGILTEEEFNTKKKQLLAEL